MYFNTISDSDLSDHAGVYIGDGYFIHASSGAHKVVVSNLTTGLIRNIELVSNLKQMNPECAVAVLVNSEQDEEVPQLRELGVADFIKKPYSMPEFSSVLAQYSAAEEQPEA